MGSSGIFLICVFDLLQAIDAGSVLQVTMVTHLSLLGTASHASATITSTCQTRGHVKGALASAGSACTTPKAPPAASAGADTLGMLPNATAGVRTTFS